jgi:hypothetical protein
MGGVFNRNVLQECAEFRTYQKQLGGKSPPLHGPEAIFFEINSYKSILYALFELRLRRRLAARIV